MRSILPFLLLVTGCESVKSTDVATDAIWADFSATVDADGGTRGQAVLRVGGETANTYVELDGGDALSATVGEETQDLSMVSVGELKVYLADFATDAEDSPVTFAFTREVETSAPSSTTSIPAPFTLTAPVGTPVVSRTTNPVTVTWEPAGSADTMAILLRSDCILDAYADIDGDPGSHTFEAGSLVPVDSQEGNTCEAEVTVWRRRFGTLDPAFTTGGSVQGTQERTASLSLAP